MNVRNDIICKISISMKEHTKSVYMTGYYEALDFAVRLSRAELWTGVARLDAAWLVLNTKTWPTTVVVTMLH